MRLRLVAFTALAAFGLERWGAMLAAPERGRAWAGVVLALLVALACLALRLPRGGRAAASAVALAAAVPGALVVAGVPARLLLPRHWDELTAGLGRGFSAMPDMLLPFLGPGDSWPARTILAGGGLIVVLAAWLAFRPRRADAPPWAAAVVLGVLAGVPAVVLPGDAAVGRGIVLMLGLVALLASGRPSAGGGRVDLRVAPAILVLATAAAVALFPALDGARPWFAYEAAARGLARAPERFSFSHTYGPISWPRDGRELLRVRAARPGYWKAADLETFDGLRWLAQPAEVGSVADAAIARVVSAHPEWRRRVDITVRGLASPDLVAPGEALAISGHLGGVDSGGTPGRLVWQLTPRDGDTYSVESYDPRPTRAELARAPADYPEYLRQFLAVPLPPAGGGRSGQGGYPVYIAGRWGRGEPASAAGPARVGTAASVLGASAYAGVGRLARRLAAGAPTPYAFVRRVERYLSRGFSYTETPPSARVPLAAFLLRTKRGYCQHFSGAMALLLRLGGVPARVTSGFAPGHRDPRTGEWVVTDLDAHSWVEVWFPGIGWVTFDPTPAAAPAGGQATVNHAPLASLLGSARRSQLNKDLAQTQKAPKGRAGRTTLTPAHSGGGFPWLPVLAAVAVLAATALLVRRRGPGRPGPEHAVAELERALRRTGRPLGSGTTLFQLEARLVRSADAAGYVRALRALRYGVAGGGPTGAQRRGLRRELARGLGPLGALRSWWALPPRP